MEIKRGTPMKIVACTLATVVLTSAIHFNSRTDRIAASHGNKPLVAESNEVKPNTPASLVFVRNADQTDPRRSYSAHVAGGTFHFNTGGATFLFTKGKKRYAFGLSFPGSHAAVEPTGIKRGTGTVNYLIGDDVGLSRTGLPTYAEIVYRNLWPGIDLSFRGEKGELKYEFRVAPGADPKNIRVAYRGIEQLSLRNNGDLLIHTASGVLNDSAPLTYQEIGGERVAVASRYAVAGNCYRFETDGYDRSHSLIIDPGLDYSTYLGGSGSEQAWDITVDTSGNAYVTGDIFQSTNFPTTTGAFDISLTGSDFEAFVTKLD